MANRAIPLVDLSTFVNGNEKLSSKLAANCRLLSTDILLSVFIAKAHLCYGESGNYIWMFKDAFK